MVFLIAMYFQTEHIIEDYDEEVEDEPEPEPEKEHKSLADMLNTADDDDYYGYEEDY